MENFFEKVVAAFPSYTCERDRITIIFKSNSPWVLELEDFLKDLKPFLDNNVSPQTHCSLVIYYRVKFNRYDKLWYSFIGNMPTNNFNIDYVINEFNNEIEVLKPEIEFN